METESRLRARTVVAGWLSLTEDERKVLNDLILRFSQHRSGERIEGVIGKWLNLNEEERKMFEEETKRNLLENPWHKEFMHDMEEAKRIILGPLGRPCRCCGK